MSLPLSLDRRAQNDRLVAAAVAFCEAHARKFSTPPPSREWELVPGQAINYQFKAKSEADARGRCAFVLRLPWLDAFDGGCTLRFPCCPGRVDGLVFKVRA